MVGRIGRREVERVGNKRNGEGRRVIGLGAR